LLATAHAAAPTTSNTGSFALSPVARPVLTLLCIGLALSPFAVNSSLIALACGSLIAIILLVWQADVPPALLIISGVQWLQGSLKLFAAELGGVELWTVSRATHNLEEASALTMIWALVIALGMRIALYDFRPTPDRSSGVEVSTALTVYLAWSAGVQVLSFVTPDAARQVLVALSDLRWATVYVLFATVLRRRQGYLLLVLSLVIEIALGFLSFFSSFKTVLLVLLAALLATTQRVSMRQLLSIIATVAFTIYLGIMWSAIKGEYRGILNDGSKDQAVRVGVDAQAEALQRIAGKVDSSAFDDATDRFVDRIAYVTYLAHVIDFVPHIRPHEDGRIWLGALDHVLLPRVLFPDKAALESDTVIAERFTGLSLGSHRGTSISIGLPAESYVDFGIPIMFGPALFLGILHGLAFRLLMRRREHAPYGAGFAVAFATPYMLVELVAAKALGSLLSLSIIAVAAWLLLLPALLKLGSRFSFFNIGPDRRGTVLSNSARRS
jgi:hypothetical protein